MRTYKGDYETFLKSISTLEVPVHDGHGVYLNNYLYSHLDQLKRVYISVLKVLEEDNFNYFSREFLLANGPDHYDLNLYGREFSNFLKNRAELKGQAYLPFLALIDFHWYEQKKVMFKVPKGLIGMWSKIINDEKLGTITIDEDIAEVVIIKEIDGEFNLVVREGS